MVILKQKNFVDFISSKKLSVKKVVLNLEVIVLYVDDKFSGVAHHKSEYFEGWYKIKIEDFSALTKLKEVKDDKDFVRVFHKLAIAAGD